MLFIFCRKLPKILYGLCILIIIFACVQALLLLPEAQVSSQVLLGKSIVIDPGHGGFDPGVSGCTVSREADINLAVASSLAALLREGGAEVLLLRESDRALAGTKSADLSKRVQLAEQAEADIYLSLHCNAFEKDSPWHGAQCFYHAKNAQAGILAECIQNSLKASLQNTDRTALTHNTTYILKNLTMPAVIVEMGFLSNREEESKLLSSEYQMKMALAIYTAVCRYYASAQ